MSVSADGARMLLLLRHAQAEDSVPGHRDEQRPLTAYGRTQAAEVGAYLRSEQISVDQTLCSSARRTRETVAELVDVAAVDVEARLYNAGSDTILQAIQEIPDEVRTALVVGHAPGIPGLAHDLADVSESDTGALHEIEYRFPSATLVGLAFDGPWADLRSARLTFTRIPA